MTETTAQLEIADRLDNKLGDEGSLCDKGQMQPLDGNRTPVSRWNSGTREERIRTADALIDILGQHGVEIIFGVPGGAIIPLNDALLDRPEIRVVTTRHEADAVFAAAGYARATGRLGVVLVTSGPGVLNSITGIASAYCDGLPILIMAGEVPRRVFGKGALQEGSANGLNIVGMTKHITKLALELTGPDAAPSFLSKAIATATSGRCGPVLLSMPVDVTSAEIRKPKLLRKNDARASVDRGLVEEVAATLLNERVAILAGSGIRWGNGPTHLRMLAEKIQSPVMTTPKAKGVFPEDHPLSLGVFGHGGHPSTTRYLEQGVDVLLAVGTGLSDPATADWSPLLQPRRHFIQINIDELDVGVNYQVSVALVGAASDWLEELVATVKEKRGVVGTFGVERYKDASDIQEGRDGLILPQRALWEIQRAMPRDTIYSCDIGEHLFFATHYLEITDPQGFLTMTGLGSMGTSVGGALGIKYGLPERPVVAICGDGSFSSLIGSIETAAREEVPLLVAVMNNGSYALIELGHMAIYGRTRIYSTERLDIPSIAEAVGAKGFVVERNHQIAALNLNELLATGPVVLDIHIDASERMPNKRFEKLMKASE